MLPEWFFDGKVRCVHCVTLEQAKQLWDSIRRVCPGVGPDNKIIEYEFSERGDQLTYNFRFRNNSIDWGWCLKDYYANRGFEIYEFDEALAANDFVEPISVDNISLSILFERELGYA